MDKIVEVQGVDISQEGQGIAKTQDGYTVFVPFLLPGEKGQVKIIKDEGSFGRGELLEWTDKTSDRVEPLCPVYHECGGCQLQHLSYEAQLNWKEKKVRDSLIRIGGLQNPKVKPIIGMEEPWYYRNRGQFAIGEQEGKLTWGFFAPRSHSVIAIDKCPIHHRYVNEAMQTLVPQLEGLHSYFEARGSLRHISMRCGVNTEEVLATIVLSEPTNKKSKLNCQAVSRAVGIVENINKSRNSKILGEKERTICGQNNLEEKLLNLRFRISSQSFFQNNTLQTEKLYQKALEYAEPQGKKILDLYSGIGSITLAMATKAREAVGVEIVKAAVKDAELNAKLNGLSNVRFYALDAANAFKQESTTPDVLVLDPPRKGVENRVLDSILDLAPKTIVYVSCNPDTLARDIRILSSEYELIEATPVDVFPQTTHVECVVLMSRVKD